MMHQAGISRRKKEEENKEEVINEMSIMLGLKKKSYIPSSSLYPDLVVSQQDVERFVLQVSSSTTEISHS